VTVRLPKPQQRVWLWGRRPFSDPLAVRRWSIALRNPDDWYVYWGIVADDCKLQAERSTDDLTGALLFERPSGRLLDGCDALPQCSENDPGGCSHVFTCAVDVERKTFTVQTIGPSISNRADPRNELSAIAAALAKARDGGGGLPVGPPPKWWL
jgi:hypothetical protein